MRYFRGLTNYCLLVLATLSVGCAKAPESISAAYVSHVSYQSWTCQQLGDEDRRLASALALSSKQQEQARTNDTVGVILLGLPVSSMSGDNIAPQIARLKGEIEAVRKASREKGCLTQPATTLARR